VGDPLATFETGDANGLRYRLRRERRAGAHPLVVFLHGAGERGDDNAAQIGYPFFRADAGFFAADPAVPFHVYAPQAPADAKWVDVPRWDAEPVHAPAPTPALARVFATVLALAARPEVDARRIVLAGLSMGAFGVFDLLARAPRIFAAAVAVCGAADLATVPQFQDVPITLYHGAKDGAVPVERSRAIVAALAKVSATARYVEYPDRGHDAWNAAFADPKLAPWLWQVAGLNATPSSGG
jgi:predicted peptidase